MNNTPTPVPTVVNQNNGTKGGMGLVFIPQVSSGQLAAAKK